MYGEAFYSRAFGNIIPAPEKHCHALQDGDHLSLAEALMKKALSWLRSHNPDFDPALAKRLLTDDIKINSQGLEIWLSRREK